MSARLGARLGGSITWFERHKQRLVYLLLAGTMVVAVGAGTVGGFLLRHAANIERQALRTQLLEGEAVELQGFSLQAQAEGKTRRLATARKEALEDAEAAFQAVRAHDRAEGDRIRSVYLAYVRSSTRDFNRASAAGPTSLAEQRQIDSRLSRLQSMINNESGRLARAAHVANPRARLALLTTAAAAAMLVALLIWQFELQRRAGRIDRDNVARSEELIRLRGEFVAAVSHELRTPLTSITGYLDLIKDSGDENLTSEQKASLAVVQRSSNRLRQLVSDLLLVAEAEGGMLALDLHAVDLDSLAIDCVEAARPTAAARQIQLSVSANAVRPVEGDPMRLAQIMDNLVSNAIKFTPEGGRVDVRTAFLEGRAVFEVSDSGPGIAAADQVHLFERFFRTRAAIDQAVAGTGLGLTITKAIVDAHHGSITVESRIGKGATFTVRLPETQSEARPRLD